MRRWQSDFAACWHFAHGVVVFACLLALVSLSQWDGWYGDFTILLGSVRGGG